MPQINGEAISFLGDTLRHPEIDVDEFLHADSLLQEAKAVYREDSTDLQGIIWYGRRLAYLHRYKEAIDVFTRGLEIHPHSPELYRHRGHRFITLRQPENAVHDLELGMKWAQQREMEIEPDGVPNKLDIPLSNLHFNIYYHLGLAWYLQANYPKAVDVFLSGMQYADNPDLKVAMTYWLYMSTLRSGDRVAADALLADIHPDMEIIENEPYYRQLLIFKGEATPPLISDIERSPDQFVNDYGMSCWYEANGRIDESAAIRRLILSTDQWPSFGYIAAEADSARLILR